MSKKFRYFQIKEVGYGEDKSPTPSRKRLRPWESKDSELIGKTTGYEIYLNRKRGELYIYPTEYHSGTIVIPRNGLERLVLDLNQKKDS